MRVANEALYNKLQYRRKVSILMESKKVIMINALENLNKAGNNTILKMMKRETNISKIIWILMNRSLRMMNSFNKNLLSKIMMMKS